MIALRAPLARRLRRLAPALGALAVAAGFAGSAAVSAEAAARLGVYGNAPRFDRLTGQQTVVRSTYLGWGQGVTWGTKLGKLLPTLRTVPMLALMTGNYSTGAVEVITPGQIAAGRGDAFLGELNRAIAGFAGRVYVRPLPEMNGHFNPYCAVNADGSRRDPAHGNASFRRAFQRIYLLLHGGPLETVNARLRALGLAPARTGALRTNPRSRLTVIWNPQGRGSPDVRGNRPIDYWPGKGYVDMVAADIYLNRNGRALFSALDHLYATFPGKPFGIAEWGTFGIDDPSFVAQMTSWVDAHRRTELLVWFNGRTGGEHDIERLPRILSAYRRLVVG